MTPARPTPDLIAQARRKALYLKRQADRMERTGNGGGDEAREAAFLTALADRLAEYAEAEVVEIARCPEHGLHGQRLACFACGAPVEQVRMIEVPHA